MDSLDAVRQAIGRIEEQITEPIRVSEIAQASGLSPWHFQRVFRAVVGETVGGYIRKRRLSKSIEALLETDRRILDIALEHGFESQEAYTRAFRALFELPPGRFRERGQRVTTLAAPRIITERIEHLARIRALEARIAEADAARYVGVQGRFVTALSEESDNAAVIPALWHRFREERNKIASRIILEQKIKLNTCLRGCNGGNSIVNLRPQICNGVKIQAHPVDPQQGKGKLYGGG